MFHRIPSCPRWEEAYFLCNCSIFTLDINLFPDKDPPLSHIIHYLFNASPWRWRHAWRISCWAGAILEEDQCRTTCQYEEQRIGRQFTGENLIQLILFPEQISYCDWWRFCCAWKMADPVFLYFLRGEMMIINKRLLPLESKIIILLHRNISIATVQWLLLCSTVLNASSSYNTHHSTMCIFTRRLIHFVWSQKTSPAQYSQSIWFL